ncbi:5'-methylthioadenosine/adenosylhomocysteine nucleosidase [Caloramator sp. CAR-1]|uniref:5'-methylthioadenosine/adenosylhomocysteine nucleosidase n=2 Tax=unclassified Caloramator TaxID=2629145 RepID=UPI0026E483D4|nr:5'-methylthioadenosine/adenosylhomocysteine nucleosidase [Caloramator sp. CAR-1]MDO6354378.1 5'-methylthioadenosine/adenosylhomocysteine nucleosidase [Caloramator sp. CAR-1]
MIGIIGAMEEEILKLKKMMKVDRIEKKANMEFYKGILLNKDVVVVRSGIGKVNAAICTQILIDDFNVDIVINTGVAGRVNEKLNPGDVVISKDLVQHDVDGTCIDYKPGQIPRMDDYIFKADEKLISLAFEATKDIEHFNVHIGRIATGDQVIADSKKLIWLKETFDALAVEMEGAAIAHASYINNIPFVVIRSISDFADENHVADYEKYINIAIENSISILTNMLKKL